MTDDENPLARVNLHAWQPPPPRDVDPAALLSRMVAPAPRPSRARWVIAALALANVALVASLLVVVTRDEPTPAVLAAGGPVDTGTRDSLRRLEEQQAQLQHQLVDVQQLRATIASLSDRVQKCEAKTVTSTTPTPTTPTPTTPTRPSPKPVGPSEIATTLEPSIEPASEGSPPSEPNDSLDRAMITAAVAKVRPAINQCGSGMKDAMPIRVQVRVKVTPFGRPAASVVQDTSSSIGPCVVREMNKAKFPRTKNGGTFLYPFMFGMELE